MARGAKERAAAAAPPAARGTVAIVVARWNSAITAALAAGAERRAREAGIPFDRFEVAGSFELPAAAALLAETGRYDAVVPIGCLVRGETPHFDVLARAVADGLMRLSVRCATAIAFGVLTCDTIEQAAARAGEGAGNKGAEAMDAALSLMALRQAALVDRRSAATASARPTSTNRSDSPGGV